VIRDGLVGTVRSLLPVRSKRSSVLKVGLVFLLLVAAPPLAAAEGTVASEHLQATRGPSTSSCGPILSSTYHGTLPAMGNPPLPSVAGISLQAHYSYMTQSGSTLGAASHCVATSTTGKTSNTGGFALHLTVIPNATGPFGPLTFGVIGGSPPGYLLRSSIEPGTVALTFVQALSKVILNPGSPVIVSVGAPTIVEALGRTADNQLSPATLGYHWILTGTGWIPLGPQNGSNATVEALVGAGPGYLQVWVNGTYNGSNIRIKPAFANLTGISTEIASAGLTPGTLDEEWPGTVQVLGNAAAGYTYEGIVYPGLSESKIYLPCRSSPEGIGWVGLNCSGRITYHQVGVATPLLVLTNGFSAAEIQLQNVSINNPPGLQVATGSLIGYSNRQISIQISIANGTGTPPYGPACVSGELQALTCTQVFANQAALQLSYPIPGQYLANISVRDSAGANVTQSIPVEVVGPPSSSSIVGSAQNATIGQTVDLSSKVQGGLLPVAYWWNASSPFGVISNSSGVLARDGILSTGFLPTQLGTVTVTLTILDGLVGCN
jgi:hypothetical protein